MLDVVYVSDLIGYTEVKSSLKRQSIFPVK